MNKYSQLNIIDSHIHTWWLDDKYSIWTREKISALHRDFTLEDFKEENKQLPLEGVFLVQAVTDTAETIEQLGNYANDSFVKGVIGWVNLAADDIEEQIQILSQIPKFSGIRAHPPHHFDTEWLLSEPTVRGMNALTNKNIPIDYLINTTQFKEFRPVFDKVPNVKAVLNHGGRPFVMTGDTEAWERDIRSLARDTDCYCKLSGLVERAGVEWDKETLKPWLDILIDSFGPERLMYASNWPIMTLMATPNIWVNTLLEIFDDFGLSQSSCEQILSKTVMKVYRSK